MSNGIGFDLRKRSWQRHELLRVAPEFWPSALASRTSAVASMFLTTWAAQGWPVIVRRRMDGDSPDMVPVGVPLPPAAGKLRIALAIPEEAVSERLPSASLLSVAHAANPAWGPTIHALAALGACHGVSPAAFGSLLWQSRTGLPYLSPRSDIDVLWAVGDDCNIPSLLDGIAAAEQNAPMRIDGELVFSDGGGVNWRELRSALSQSNRAEVLVKSIDRAHLLDVASLSGPRWAA